MSSRVTPHNISDYDLDTSVMSKEIDHICLVLFTHSRRDRPFRTMRWGGVAQRKGPTDQLHPNFTPFFVIYTQSTGTFGASVVE